MTKKFFRATFLVILALGAAFLFIPWKNMLERRLETLLSRQGYGEVAFTIGDVGLYGAALNDITFGSENPLILKNVDLHYSPRDLWNRRLQDVTFRGLDLQLRKNEGRWRVKGIESENEQAKVQGKIPVSQEGLAFIPFDRMAVEDSKIDAADGPWQLNIPVNLQWSRAPEPSLIYRADGLTFQYQEREITTGDLHAIVKLDREANQWSGTWSAENIALNDDSLEIPPLDATGRITIFQDRIVFSGAAASADNNYRMSFALEYYLNDAASSRLSLSSVSMPWKDGRIGIKKIDIPLQKRGPLAFTVNVDKVSLDDLMQDLTGKRVTATGRVSGDMPIIFNPDGTILFRSAHLAAISPGAISMPPESLPGDNEQMALVRDILANLQYSIFSIGLSSSKNGTLAVLLTLEGSNPDVYNGRLVKLNINLTGDLIEFARQNLLLLTKPETLLEEHSDEKN